MKDLTELNEKPLGRQQLKAMKIIVGITGASGSVYGWRLLEKLRMQEGVETHLVLSRSGERTAFLEMGKAAADVV